MNKNEVNVLMSALSLVESWRLAGQWQDAQILLQGLQPVAARIDQEAMAMVWLQLGRVLTEESMFGGVDTAVKRQAALEKAMTLAEPTNDANLMGNIYDALGFSLHAAYLDSDRSQEPTDELDFFERALTLRREQGTVAQVAESLFHVGLVYDVIRKDYEQALLYHQEAYQLASEAGDKVMASYAIRHIGFAHLAAEDTAAAEQAFLQSLTLREEAGFVPGVAFALPLLAHMDVLKGDKTSALSRLKRSQEILESLGATARVARIEEQIISLREA